MSFYLKIHKKGEQGLHDVFHDASYRKDGVSAKVFVIEVFSTIQPDNGTIISA